MIDNISSRLEVGHLNCQSVNRSRYYEGNGMFKFESNKKRDVGRSLKFALRPENVFQEGRKLHSYLFLVCPSLRNKFDNPILKLHDHAMFQIFHTLQSSSKLVSLPRPKQHCQKYDIDVCAKKLFDITIFAVTLLPRPLLQHFLSYNSASIPEVLVVGFEMCMEGSRFRRNQLDSR